jgi:hypothetical protein
LSGRGELKADFSCFWPKADFSWFFKVFAAQSVPLKSFFAQSGPPKANFLTPPPNFLTPPKADPSDPYIAILNRIGISGLFRSALGGKKFNQL